MYVMQIKSLMKKLLLLLAICLLATQSSPVLAQESGISPQHIETIKLHCPQAQVSLKQFQKSELVARLNRGRGYEQQLKQMAALNTRLVENKIDASFLTQTTAQIQIRVEQFRTAYEKYDKTLLASTRIDCTAKPTEFYELLAQSRLERVAVANEVDQVKKMLVLYREGVVRLIATDIPEKVTGDGVED